VEDIMKKKLALLTVIIGLVALVTPGSVAMASSGDIFIELSDIAIDDDTPMVGETVTISGSATITAYAEISDWNLIAWQPRVEAYAESSVVLVKPNATVAGNFIESDYDLDTPLYNEGEAQATVVYDWSFDYKLDEPGFWSVAQSGYGYYDWEYIDVVFTDKGYKIITVSDSGDESKVVTKEFMVGEVIPERNFTFNVPMGYGGSVYSNDSKVPGPTEREIDCVGRIDGVQYRFVIPEGTIITNGNGEKALNLHIDNIDGNTLHSTFKNTVFSKPVTVYKADGIFYVNEYGQYFGGDWIEIGSFTEILDHTGTLN
jgi:hypothetical protein